MATQSSAARIESRDADELATLVKPWQLILRPISPGSFYSQLECLQFNDILVYRENLALRQLVTGSTPADYFVFGGPLSARNPAHWCGDEATPQHLCYGRPASEVDFILPDNSDHVAILVPTHLMRSYFGNEAIETALSDQRHHLACNVSHGHNLLASTARIISKYMSNPELLADASECKAIESQLMRDLARVFPYDNTNLHCATPNQRRKAFLRAIEISEDLRATVSVPELAQGADVNQRTLRLAFQESIGVSPSKYLRWTRMRKVHHELYTNDPEIISVTKAAGGKANPENTLCKKIFNTPVTEIEVVAGSAGASCSMLGPCPQLLLI